MQPDVRAALVRVARRLGDQGVTYALGGSGLLWAHGLVADVRDLDLMVEATEEGALRQAVSEWVIGVTREGTDLWASDWFAELDVDGVDVDVIGGMAFRHHDGVARLPVRALTRVDVDGVRVPVADPALWWAVYQAYAPEKARLLEQVVDAEGRQRIREELGLAE